jgi:hypothetical protein
MPRRVRPSLRANLIAVSIAAISGCSSPPLYGPVALPSSKPTSSTHAGVEKDPSPATSSRLDGPRLEQPTRATFDRSVAVDYASLPVMHDEEMANAKEGKLFEIVREDKTPRTCPEKHFPRRKITYKIPPFWSFPSVVRVGDAVLPAPSAVDGQFEDPYRILGRLTNDEGAGPHDPESAEWVGYDPGTRDANAIDVMRFEGTFALSHAKASRAMKVHAVALIPGVLYGFRRCTAGCGLPLGSPSRKERLEIVAPPADWVGSSAELERQRMTPDQSFTNLSGAVGPGSSTTLTLAVWSDDVARFAQAAKAPDATTWLDATPSFLSFDVDVVWAQGEAPSLTAFVGVLQGAASALHEPTRVGSQPQPDCYPVMRMYD